MSTYVYGFTRARHPLPIDGVNGVGEQAPPLRVVRHDDLSAVVSDAPPGLRAKRRDLDAHARVLEALSAAGTVLPMRFGTVAADDEAVEAQLAAEAARYSGLLSRLDGCVEINVKAFHREDEVLRELLREHRELREANAALRAAGGGSHQDKVAFGERIAAALEDRRAQDARRVVAALRPHASEVNLGPPVDGCFANASFLVGSGERKAFEGSLSRLRQELSALVDLRRYGPLPPYSFVAVGVAEAAGKVEA
jgi:Gas vesicle synthesis protein GvpL/GvpF